MLSTPTLVRNNLGFADITLTDDILNQYIMFAQAEVEKATRRTFTASDQDYELAVSAVTDLATERAIKRPPGRTGGISYTIDEFKLDKSKQEELKQKNAEKFRRSAEKAMNLLVSEQSDLPFTTDQAGM
jgi:hypothetical protein